MKNAFALGVVAGVFGLACSSTDLTEVEIQMPNGDSMSVEVQQSISSASEASGTVIADNIVYEVGVELDFTTRRTIASVAQPELGLFYAVEASQEGELVLSLRDRSGERLVDEGSVTEFDQTALSLLLATAAGNVLSIDVPYFCWPYLNFDLVCDREGNGPGGCVDWRVVTTVGEACIEI